MLIDCGIRCEKYDFEELAEHLLGKCGYFATLISMAMFAYGAQIAYLVILGDTVPVVLHYIFPELFVDRIIVMIIIASVIILPISLLKDMSALSFTSLISILADVILIIIVVIVAPPTAHKEGLSIHVDDLRIMNTTVFAGIGTFSFALICQHNSFLVFKSLKVPSSENWLFVTYASILSALFLCFSFAITGYLNFLDETKGDLLKNFPDDSNSIGFARVLLAICMILTYPMECFVSRHCLLSMLDKLHLLPHKDESKVVHESNNTGLFGFIKHYYYENTRTNITRIISKDNISDKSTSFELVSVGKTKDDVFNKIHENDTDERKSNDEELLTNKFTTVSFDAISDQKSNKLVDSPPKNISNSDVNSKSKDEVVIKVEIEDSVTNLIIFLSTVFLWGGTLIIAIVFDDLGIVLSLTGAVAGSMLGYILPGLIFFQAFKEELNHAWNDYDEEVEVITGINVKIDSFLSRVFKLQQFFMPAFMLIFGFATMIIGVTTVFMNSF
jgi:amino acid permease